MEEGARSGCFQPFAQSFPLGPGSFSEALVSPGSFSMGRFLGPWLDCCRSEKLLVRLAENFCSLGSLFVGLVEEGR